MGGGGGGGAKAHMTPLQENQAGTREADSLEGVGAASRNLKAGGAPPDPRHLTLDGVLAAEGARVPGVLGDLLSRATHISVSRKQRRQPATRQRGTKAGGLRVKGRGREGGRGGCRILAQNEHGTFINCSQTA